MHFKQFYVGCLAHASYLIGDGGEAVVVDPSRDIQMYLDEAEAHGLAIRWILETHLHADFVSGHRELAARTGATIGIGARAEAGYPHRGLREGDEIRVGALVIRAIETPGHTPESLSFLVYDRPGDDRPWGVLTGDTLFVGDVGRVDILSSRMPVTELAGLMYDSLHRKLLALPDETRVYPAHGAGSLCGRNISKDTWSTIGRERMMNAALKPMTREAFIAEVTRDVPETPIYYLHSRDTNKAGPRLDAERPMPPMMAARDVAARVARGGVLLDTRMAAVFGAGHAAGSLNVPLDGQYASWVGTLVAPDQEILLVVDRERVEEAVMRLARVGYENVVGVLEGGLEAWRAAGLPVDATPQAAASSLVSPGRRILDVRRAREFEEGHLPGAVHIPLAELPARAGELDRDAEWAIICASGYRSSIAGSVLERAGFTRVVNAAGGMAAWHAAGLPVESGSPAGA
jgi:glyoxylase-like metal-dependent hydrolase (beta-lactamase superfamily II)/rhodanese-related sulfurtransferase